MLNVVALCGRLTKDAAIYEKEESVVATFSLAFNKGEASNFIDCIAFGKSAQCVKDYLAKGDKISVTGELEQHKFSRKDGTEGSAIRIIVHDIDFVDVLFETSPKEEPKPEPKPEPKEEKPVSRRR